MLTYAELQIDCLGSIHYCGEIQPNQGKRIQPPYNIHSTVYPTPMRIPGDDKWLFQAVRNLLWFGQRIILPNCDLRKANRTG